MFKNKWQKKYEQAMKTVEFWRDYHDKQIRMLAREESNLVTQRMIDIHMAQKIELGDVLSDMKQIMES